MIDGNNTIDAPNGFVRASELYHVPSSTEYNHPDQQATDEQVARKIACVAVQDGGER